MKVTTTLRCCIAFLFLVYACSDPAPGNASEKSSSTIDSQQLLRQNKEVVIRFYKALSDTNWALAKSYTDKDYQHHFIKDTGFAVMPWSGFEEGYKMSHNAFPDWKITPVTLVAEGDYVSVLLRGEGTHLGSFAGIAPTKVKAKAPIMLLHLVKNGKLIADWEMMNTASFLKQLK